MTFNLDSEIESYLNQLNDKRYIHRLTLEEIESHIRDAVDMRTENGMNEESALRLALTELGSPRDVARQFAALSDNKFSTKWKNQASYYFNWEIVMRIMFGALIGMCFIMLGTLLEGGQISGMIGIRPLGIVLGGALGGLMIAYPIHSIKAALLLALTGRDANRESYQQAAAIFKSYGDLLVLSSGVASVIGVIHVLSNLSNPQNIGPGLAVAILGMLYCLLMKLFLCKPLYDSFMRRAELSTSPEKSASLTSPAALY